MKVQIPVVALALCMAMACASAQSYKWVDKDGKVHYGDSPPPGAKVTPLKATTAPPPPPAPAAKDGSKDGAKDPAKDAKKGPMTTVEQEQAYRKRKLAEDEARKKEDEARASDAGKKKNCEQSQQTVRQLESGQRIVRTDAKGEPYYVDDDQRVKELAAARTSAAEWCK